MNGPAPSRPCLRATRASGIRSIARAVIQTVAVVAPATLAAQAYPTKPVRIVVASQAGGSLDLVARLAAQKLGAALGRSVVIDNRPGAAGNIATEMVAKSAPDGYTLLAMSAAFSVNPSLFRKVPYDPVKDFDPVGMLTTYMLFLVAHPSLPARSVKELIALARARPGRINYASAATGTTTHIAGELFASMTRVKMTHIPFKGTGSQLPAVIGGEVALAFGSTAVVPLVGSGRLVLLGVSGAKRFPAFPQVPTIAEAGVPGFEVTSWNALFAPAGTPGSVVMRLNGELTRALVQPDALEVFDKQGLQAAPGSPEALGAVVRAELEKWAKVIRAANIPLQ